MKIRTKLLITFLSAIILPIIITMSLFYIYFSYQIRDSKFNKMDINKSAIELTTKISLYYANIGNYSLFDRLVKDELAPYSSIIEHIEIVDLNGNIVYNSIDKNKINKTVDLYKLMAHSNDVYNFSNGGNDDYFYLKLIKPLIVEGSSKGFIIFRQNPYNLIKYVEKIAYPVLWFGTGSIILVIVFFSWLISRGIIIPLKELSAATEKISNGNLDFEIKYKNKDEFGTLCTAFETMRNRLKDSLIKQAEYENSRKELVASISHDLRTPLTSIKGYVEGLRDGIVKDPEKFNKYLDVIYNKTESVNRLIDDLFEYSKLDLNRLEMNKQKTESREMLEKIFITIKYDIEKEGITVNTAINFNCFMVEVDMLRIEEVINNLVSNAMRHTRTTINLKAEIQNGNLLVSVGDDGYGIKEDEKEKIFERFYRGEKSRSLKTGGTGLGLAIAKKIIEDHFGNIWVESVEGKGSTFFFSIPQAKNNFRAKP